MTRLAYFQLGYGRLGIDDSSLVNSIPKLVLSVNTPEIPKLQVVAAQIPVLNVIQQTPVLTVRGALT